MANKVHEIKKKLSKLSVKKYIFVYNSYLMCKATGSIKYEKNNIFALIEFVNYNQAGRKFIWAIALDSWSVMWCIS